MRIESAQRASVGPPRSDRGAPGWSHRPRRRNRRMHPLRNSLPVRIRRATLRRRTVPVRNARCRAARRRGVAAGSMRDGEQRSAAVIENQVALRQRDQASELSVEGTAKDPALVQLPEAFVWEAPLRPRRVQLRLEQAHRTRMEVAEHFNTH